MMGAGIELVPLDALNRRLRGAKIRKALLSIGGGQSELVITTDKVDADTGLAVSLVITGAQRVELSLGVLTVIGAEDDG